MNERIKELTEQAREYARQYVAHCRTYGYYMEYNEEQTQFEGKFAELIVKECVKVMYDNAIERKVPPDINQTPTHYAIAVLEHFGVEE